MLNVKHLTEKLIVYYHKERTRDEKVKSRGCVIKKPKRIMIK